MEIDRVAMVLEILKTKTNIGKMITVTEIINLLKSEGISVSRNTIKKDISILKEFGVNIHEEKCRSNATCYSIEGIFTINEYRVLLDVLNANRFLNREVKKNIAEKLMRTLSYEDRVTLRSKTRTTNINTGNIDLVQNLSIIHKAINENKYLNFTMVTRSYDNKIKPMNNKENIIPKAVFYENDRYYLIAFNDKELLRNYRIDRMASVYIGKYHNKNISISLENYSLKNFDMFVADEIERVEFKVKKELINSMIEKFGEAASLYKYDENYFKLSVEVGINKGLLRWILKQGSDIEVIYPMSLRVKVKEEILNMYNLY